MAFKQSLHLHGGACRQQLFSSRPPSQGILEKGLNTLDNKKSTHAVTKSVGEAEYFRSEQNTIYVLQALRGVAVLLVVFYHATQLLAAHYQITPLGGFFLFGFSGVHIFFVLSGFIIYTIHFSDIGKPQRYLAYATKRFIRVYPTYWVILAILSFQDLLSGTITIQNIYQNMGLLLKPPQFIDPVCWTLLFEILFYIIFSSLILNRTFGLIVIACWALTVVETNFLGFQVSSIVSYAFHKYTVLFMMGMAASHRAMQLKELEPATKNRLGYTLCLSGLLVFVLTAFYCLAYRIMDWDTWIITLGFGLAGGMFMACTLSDTLEGFFQKRKILLSMGDASYSIYLLHYPLLLLVISYSKAHFSMTSQISISLAFVTICVLAVISGWSFHWCVERPLLKHARRHLLKNRYRTGQAVRSELA